MLLRGRGPKSKEWGGIRSALRCDKCPLRASSQVRFRCHRCVKIYGLERRNSCSARLCFFAVGAKSPLAAYLEGGSPWKRKGEVKRWTASALRCDKCPLRASSQVRFRCHRCVKIYGLERRNSCSARLCFFAVGAKSPLAAYLEGASPWKRKGEVKRWTEGDRELYGADK